MAVAMIAEISFLPFVEKNNLILRLIIKNIIVSKMHNINAVSDPVVNMFIYAVIMNNPSFMCNALRHF